MSKNKLAAIIVACTIVIVVAIVLSIIQPWDGTPSAETYTLTTIVSPSGAGSVSPSGGEYESGVQVTLTATPASDYTFDYWSSALGKTYTTTITITMDSDKSLTANFETIVPAHFTTYTDELVLFSISYPPEWEPVPGVIEEAEQAAKDIVSSITSDSPLEEASLLFIAGLPATTGLNPNVNIGVSPLPVIMWTHDELVTATIEGHKEVFPGYHEFSRVKTTIDNRTATIIDFKATIPESDTYRFVQMISLVGKTVWAVTCTTLRDDYSNWEDDFDAIVRSLRILK